VVIPLRHGAGVTGQIAEAVHTGLPIGSTGVGLDGIRDIESITKASETASEFANALVSLHTDDAYLHQIRDRVR